MNTGEWSQHLVLILSIWLTTVSCEKFRPCITVATCKKDIYLVNKASVVHVDKTHQYHYYRKISVTSIGKYHTNIL